MGTTFDPMHDVRKELDWDNLEQRRNKHEEIFMSKLINGPAPEYLKKMLLLSNTSYSLRETLFLSNAKHNL